MKKILLIQPEIPEYRIDFFQRLHDRFGERLTVYFSAGCLGKLTQSFSAPWATRVGDWKEKFGGFAWQPGIALLPVSRGDILVVPGNPRHLSTIVLLLRARLKGTRCAWWGHYWSSTSRTWRFVLRMALMRLAHAVIFYTDGEIAEYRTGPGKGDPRPVTALNNGVRIYDIQKHRLPYKADTRPPALLFIGRLTGKTSLGLALEALAKPELASVTLDVIGDGSEEDRFREQATRLGLGPRIRWHGAITDEAEIAGIANGCRAFLYPGEVGLSLIHAMAYGLPAFVHDERWKHMPEIAAFEDGITGDAFAHGDAGALASVLSRALDAPETLQRYSGASRIRADETYNTQEMSRRFAALIEQMT